MGERAAPTRATGSPGATFGVGVNLTWLVPGVVGGSEEYTMRLLGAVADVLDPSIELRLYGRRELFARYPALADRHSIRVMPEPVGPSGLSKVTRVVLEQTWLAAVSGGDHIMHHAGGTIPFLRRQPAIVTVHDLQPLEMPGNFGTAKRLWLGRAIPHAVDVARLVLCPSRFTAERLQAMLGVPEDKIRVVMHGHRLDGAAATGDAISGAAWPGPPTPVDQATVDQATVDQASADRAPIDPGRFGRFVLYPAIAYRHKRHVDVVRSLARLGSELADLSAVFTGRAGPELETFLDEARRLGVGDRVHVLGRIPSADLRALYRHAQALVFPSAYEGFGNPALEAMAAGCPVVVSDAGALPEVVGDAGLIVPVGDVPAIAAAVEATIADPASTDARRRRGLQRAADFDLGIAAAQLAQVYSYLAESRSS